MSFNVNKVQVNRIAMLAISIVLSSCTLVPEEDFAPSPLLTDVESVSDESEAGTENANQLEVTAETYFEPAPRIPVSISSGDNIEEETLFPVGEEATISFSVNGLSLPEFINELFGNQLGLSFQLAPEVAALNDLVSLRITAPRNRQEIFMTGRQVLEDYGVQIVSEGDIYRFVLGANGSNAEAPLIVTGRALPTVPETHRPVYLVRSLAYLQVADAYGMLSSIFNNNELTIARENALNAVTIRGRSADVQQAADMLDMLDVPAMKGRYSLRIEPVFVGVDTLAENLRLTMSAQGFDIGDESANTSLIPISAMNALFVFAANEDVLDSVREWSRQLDRISTSRSDRSNGVYWYSVKNTNAENLANTLNAIVGSNGGGLGVGVQEREEMVESGPGTGNSASTDFVVDRARNMLLYRGEADRWQELMPLISELDKSTPQVLVEVVVAEVTLNESFKFGFEWGLSDVGNGQQGDLSSVFGDGGVGAAFGNGLTYRSISGSGATRLALNAFANDNNISILQRPTVLVRSGEQASVNVGQQVPVLSSNSVGEEVVDGDTSVTQQIVYRDVGVSLSVTPVIYSGGRVDLQIEQEVSASISDASTASLTPIISTKTISTSLSLDNGDSVLLAGLISTTQSKGNSRVPLLGNIPILGHLFRSDATTADRSELMVLIIPYLVEDNDQSKVILEAFREQLRLHPESPDSD